MFLWTKSFISSFQICIHIFSFSYLIALDRTFSNMLKSSGESHILVLYLILWESFQFLTFKCDISCSFFVDSLYQVEKVPLYSQVTESFIMNGYWILSNSFSVSINMIMWFFFFSLLMWWIILIDFWMFNQPCILG